VAPPQVSWGTGQLHPREPLDQFGERDRRLEAGQRRAQAVVDAVAEAEEVLVLAVEPQALRVVELQAVARDAGFDQMMQTARIAPLTTRSQVQGILIVIEEYLHFRLCHTL